ncbi:serine/threonine-protein kinase [Saccharopolyspora halophila]|uniref:serine/threonine-protein kinase n=1 Tax=Saccharopolyspora halophila TaxID=405551 RepID=UPI0031D7E3FE
MSEDLTGRRLGHYKIEGVLGRGGMSVMYRATDIRLGRKVALKVMGEHITGDAEFRERFVDEARNTSAIDHANIVPLYDFGEVDGMLYIAMRLVEGSDLASLISAGPIAPRRALELLVQIAEALDSLHEQGLVHLDLKPANVLVTTRESVHEHVYLADFGLTRRGATGHRTAGGDFLGSPTYAAPEHLRGEPVDGRTDQYALACMLFACLTGRSPFQGPVQEIIQGHLGAAPPVPGALVVLPPAVDDVLRRALAKRPEQRYATCQEMIAAARAAFGPAPGEVPAPSRAMQPVGPPSGPQPVGPPSGPQPVGPPSGPQPAQYAPAQPPQQGPPPHQQPQHQQPVRLRPPMPAGSASLARPSSGGSAKWIVPVLAALAFVVIVVVFVLMATSVGGSGGTPESSRGPSYGTNNTNDLPTSVPTAGG